MRVTPTPTVEHANIKYLVFDKIFDDSEQDILPHFTESNLFIKQALEENEANRVLVHCNRGISRAASFVSAYMIAEAGFSLDEALTYGQLNREHFSPNKNFLSQLRTFEKVFAKPSADSKEEQPADMSAQHFSVLMRQLTNPEAKEEGKSEKLENEMNKMNLEEKKE